MGERNPILRVRYGKTTLPDGLHEHPGVVRQAFRRSGPAGGEQELAIVQAVPPGDQNSVGAPEVDVLVRYASYTSRLNVRSLRDNGYFGHGPPGHDSKWAVAR